MKKTVITALFLSALLLGSQMAFAHSLEAVTAATNIPEANYPKVDSRNRAHFRIHAPEAMNVKVDICGHKYDMTRNADGFWEAVTQPLVVGFHYYFIVVDGVSV